MTFASTVAGHNAFYQNLCGKRTAIEKQSKGTQPKREFLPDI